MNIENVRQVIAKKLNISEVTNRAQIDMAIMAALEEIGANLDIAGVQQMRTIPIASGANSVIRPEDFHRLISLRYSYLVNGVENRKKLHFIPIASLDEMNEAVFNESTDELEYYSVSGEHIYVGLGKPSTGGNLLVRFQRKLQLTDIPALPDGMLVVHGAISNYLPMDDQRSADSRAYFRLGIAPSQTGAEPTNEKVKQLELPKEIWDDIDYMESL